MRYHAVVLLVYLYPLRMTRFNVSMLDVHLALWLLVCLAHSLATSHTINSKLRLRLKLKLRLKVTFATPNASYSRQAPLSVDTNPIYWGALS